MSQVTVRTRLYQPSYHRPDAYLEHEITGEILNTIKWLKPDEIAISNPAHPNKFSILHKKNILWIKDSKGKKAIVKIDPEYRQALQEALKSGVEIITMVINWTKNGDAYFIRDDLPVNL